MAFRIDVIFLLSRFPLTKRGNGGTQKEKQRHNGVPQLAAEIAGVSVWMAYKVMYGQAQSRKVNRALAIARQRLGQGQAA